MRSLITLLSLSLVFFQITATAQSNLKELEEKASQFEIGLSMALEDICTSNTATTGLCNISKSECAASTSPNLVLFCTASEVNNYISLIEFCNEDSDCLLKQATNRDVFKKMVRNVADFRDGILLCMQLYKIDSKFEKIIALRVELEKISNEASTVFNYIDLVDCVIKNASTSKQN